MKKMKSSFEGSLKFEHDGQIYEAVRVGFTFEIYEEITDEYGRVSNIFCGKRQADDDLSDDEMIEQITKTL